MDIDKNTVTFTKSENRLSREFPTAMLTISQEKNNIKLKGNSHNSKNRAIVGTFNAHINNMLKGLEKPFSYKLRIASVHFPMTASINNGVFELKNFIGGKRIRKATIPKGVDINLNGSEIEISSRDIELAGMAANRLEQLTRIVRRDRRVFQDGIFIIEKPRGKLEWKDWWKLNQQWRKDNLHSNDKNSIRESDYVDQVGENQEELTPKWENNGEVTEQL